MRKNEFYQISKLKPKKIYIGAGEQIFEDKISYYEETYSSYAHAETNGEFGDCRFEFEYDGFVLILLDIVCLGMRIKDI